jgi:hypothetical protein
LDGIHRQGTNSVGKVAAGGHDELLYLTSVRPRIVPDAPLASNAT